MGARTPDSWMELGENLLSRPVVLAGVALVRLDGRQHPGLVLHGDLQLNLTCGDVVGYGEAVPTHGGPPARTRRRTNSTTLMARFSASRQMLPPCGANDCTAIMAT